jgi:hypothetical protein
MNNQGWGKSVVEQLSKDLQREFPGIRGFSASNIWRMKTFYDTYKENAKKLDMLKAQLSGIQLGIDTIEEIRKEEIQFFGLNFSANGIQVQEAKLNALQNAKQPQTAGEVRSFLGLASYCSRFIPQFSTIAKPLRELTKNNTRWRWTNEEENSFN